MPVSIAEFDSLSDNVRKSCFGRHITISRYMDRWLDLVAGLERPQIISFLLSDVEPQTFKIEFFDKNEYQPDDKYLRPYRLNNDNSELEEQLISKASISTMTGGLRFQNYLMCLRACLGRDRFVDNTSIRKMKHYLTVLSDLDGKDFMTFEPFVEGYKSRITLIRTDLMVSVRLQVLLNTAWITESFNCNDDAMRTWISQTKISMMLDEVCDYIFTDPWHNTKKIKSTTGLLKQMMMSIPESGTRLEWNIPRSTDPSNPTILNYLHTFVPMEINANSEGIINDRFAYERVRDAKDGIVDSLEALKKEQLPYLALWFEEMLSAPPNHINAAQASLLVFIETAAGYFRSEEIPSHLGQISDGTREDGSTLHLTEEEEPPFAQNIVNEWKNALTRTEIPDDSKFFNKVLGRLTTKSSGGYAVEWDFPYNRTKIPIRSTDKVMNFLSDPDFFMSRQTATAELTEEQPGKVFTRYVPARDARAIFAVPLSRFVWDLAIGPEMMRYQSLDPEFSITKEVGRVVADHDFGIYASGSLRHLIWLMDFSAYDSTEKYNNTRRYAIQGILDGLSRYNNQSFLEWDNLSQIYSVLWKTLKEAYFKFGDDVIPLDQLNSGEYMTLVFNNFTNRANTDAIWKRIRQDLQLYNDLVRDYSQIFRRFMGDDSVQIIEYKTINTEILSKIADVSVKTTEDDGMIVNRLKTSLRLTYYEYLKKMGIMGWIIPRALQIQVMGAENNNFDVDFQEYLAGQRGIFIEHVSRGGDNRLSTSMMNFIGCLRRRVKYKDSETDSFKLKTAPALSLYLPTGLNGVGMHCRSMVGNPGVSFILSLDRVSIEAYNQAAYVLDYPRGSLKKAVADFVARGKDHPFVDGVQMMMDNLNKQKLAESNSEFVEMGSPEYLRQWKYEHSPRRIIESKIVDDPSMAEIIQLEKTKNASAIVDREQMLSAMYSRTRVSKFNCPNGHLSRLLTRFGNSGNIIIISEYDYNSKNGISFKDSMEEILEVFSVSGSDVIMLMEDEIDVEGEITVEGQAIFLNGAETRLNDLKDKLRIIHKLKFGPSSGGIKNYIVDTYPWIEYLSVELGDELDSKHNGISPIPLCSDLSSMVHRVGISSAGDAVTSRIARALVELQRDPDFPTDIRTETVVDLISKPEVIGDVSKMISVLVVLGAARNKAALLAHNIESIVKQFNITTAVSSYSTRDSFIGNLDLTAPNHDRIVNVKGASNPTSTEMFIKNLCILWMLSRGSNSAYHVNVTILGSDNELQRVLTNTNDIDKELIFNDSEIYFWD